MKFFGQMGHGPRTNQLDFGGNLDSSVDHFPGFFTIRRLGIN